MTSQIGQQIIAIHILPNTARCKGNQAMELGQLVNLNKIWKKIFFKSHAENQVGRMARKIFLFFKKALFKIKANSQLFSFNIFWQTSTQTCNKNKLCNISDC